MSRCLPVPGSVRGGTSRGALRPRVYHPAKDTVSKKEGDMRRALLLAVMLCGLVLVAYEAFVSSGASAGPAVGAYRMTGPQFPPPRP